MGIFDPQIFDSPWNIILYYYIIILLYYTSYYILFYIILYFHEVSTLVFSK